MWNDVYGYPFLGTTSDANRRFCRGPGQGPETEVEPYLKMTVDVCICLAVWIAGAGGTAVRCVLFWWGLGAEQTGPLESHPARAEGHDLSYPWQHPVLEENQPKASPQRASSLFMRGATGGRQESHQGNQP